MTAGIVAIILGLCLAYANQANWKTIVAIVAAWVVTLPVAIVLGGIGFVAFRGINL